MKQSILKSVFSIVAMGAMVVLLYGSATTETITGRPIDEDKTSKIIDGKTTDIEIISMFGSPDDKNELRNHTLYIYKYCVSKGKGVTTGYTSDVKTTQSCDELTVTFDSSGVVVTHSYLRSPTIRRPKPTKK